MWHSSDSCATQRDGLVRRGDKAVQKGASWHTVVKHEEIMKFVQNEWALYEEKTSS